MKMREQKNREKKLNKKKNTKNSRPCGKIKDKCVGGPRKHSSDSSVMKDRLQILILLVHFQE